MKPRTIGKLLSAVILGLLVSVAVNHEDGSRQQMGREAFLARQAARFDRRNAKPASVAVTLIIGVMMAGVAFGAYELVAFGISKVAEKACRGNESS